MNKSNETKIGIIDIKNKNKITYKRFILRILISSIIIFILAIIYFLRIHKKFKLKKKIHRKKRLKKAKKEDENAFLKNKF